MTDEKPVHIEQHHNLGGSYDAENMSVHQKMRSAVTVDPLERNVLVSMHRKTRYRTSFRVRVSEPQDVLRMRLDAKAPGATSTDLGIRSMSGGRLAIRGGQGTVAYGADSAYMELHHVPAGQFIFDVVTDVPAPVEVVGTGTVID